MKYGVSPEELIKNWDCNRQSKFEKAISNITEFVANRLREVKQHMAGANAVSWFNDECIEIDVPTTITQSHPKHSEAVKAVVQDMVTNGFSAEYKLVQHDSRDCLPEEHKIYPRA